MKIGVVGLGTVGFGVVEILTIASQTAQEYSLVLLIPIVDGQHNISLVNTPRIGQCSHKRAIDHIPELAVVLLLLVYNRVEGCATLTHRE